MPHRYWLQRSAALSALSLLAVPIHSLQTSLWTSSTLSSTQTHTSFFDVSCSFATPDQTSAPRSFAHNVYGAPTRQQRDSTFALYAASNEIQTDDDDMDAFMEEMLQETTEASNVESEKNVASHFIEGKSAVGIGGSDGFVYDINKLKRNLVQESVRGSKEELLELLGDGRQKDAASTKKSSADEKVRVSPRWRRERDDLIEERLSALVQANPVSTTTDSNLLDGEWSFAFATNSASSILDTSRFLLSKTKRIDSPVEDKKNVKDPTKPATNVRGGPWRFRSGKTENPFRSSTREIYLENLSGDDNAHIIDETRILGGMFQISRRYEVFGLTRTAIDLDFTESESRLFGLCVSKHGRDDFKGTKLGDPLEIQVLYLDNDLCICTTGDGLYGPLHVYTKSDLWVTGGAKRKLRLIAKTASWVSTLQSPLRIRQRVADGIATRKNRAMSTDTDLKAVNIGEVDVINDDGSTKEDEAWDGPDDPFMHLSPGERMKVLRSMSLQDIYQTANEKKEQNKKQKKKRWVPGNRATKFKRPDLD